MEGLFVPALAVPPRSLACGGGARNLCQPKFSARRRQEKKIPRWTRVTVVRLNSCQNGPHRCVASISSLSLSSPPTFPAGATMAGCILRRNGGVFALPGSPHVGWHPSMCM